MREEREKYGFYGKKVPESLLNKVFVQKFGIGRGSIHFGKKPYFSYEDNKIWKTDNGILLPSKILFQEVEFDTYKRSFRATIR